MCVGKEWLESNQPVVQRVPEASTKMTAKYDNTYINYCGFGGT